MLLQITDFSTEPLYRQISQQMGERIRRGDIPGGSALEPVRSLARAQHVSIYTAERAYEELVQQGFVESRQNDYVVKSCVPEKDKAKHTKSPATDVLLAARMQSNLCPPLPLRDTFVCIQATSQACEMVNGDMYDYFQIEKNRYGLVIGDACGHGVAAALLVSQIQAIFKSEVKNSASLHDTVSFINAHIRASLIRPMFITLFYGIYNAHSDKLTYINAGHNFPFVVRANGNYTFLTASSPALGLADDSHFNIGEMCLQAGDILILYSDGITEAMNNHREEFGEERLLEIVRKNRKLSPAEIMQQILSRLSTHLATDFDTDDRTLLICRFKKHANKQARCL
ncbi:GntR family transcriptional regulator [candidate division KSB1 bacterium]|nr:SpoIIE family protein phosphatase [candidate division KSB1 bacterium]RQW01064.1 MAG: GntR family transcriptional regulator [candidate division KSB1 bacterium]